MNVTITISELCQPTIHKTGCAHLTRIRKQRRYSGEYTADVDTIVEASQDYWSDIIGSDHGLELGSPAALDMAEEYLTDIEVGPCVKLPLR